MVTFNQLKGNHERYAFMQKQLVRMRKDSSFRYLVLALHEAAAYNTCTDPKDVLRAAHVVKEILEVPYLHDKYIAEFI